MRARLAIAFGFAFLYGFVALVLAGSASADPEECVMFSINVQDFSYPERSAQTVNRILDIHEKLGVPVDLYLSSAIAALYEDESLELLKRLATSRLAAVSYHVRPPAPYYTKFDWKGMRQMSEEEQRAIVREYETHRIDPETGRATDRPGGYSHLKELLGYAPWVASCQADGELAPAVHAVLRDLGARLFAMHGRAINFGDRAHGLFQRSEHVDLKLFQFVGQDAGDLLENAFAEARKARGGKAPWFVGVKMHDNDFIAEKSAWTTVYLSRNRRPDWDLDVRAALLSEAKQAAVWQHYEAAVGWVAAHGDRVRALNAPMLLEKLDVGAGVTEGAAPQAGKSRGPRREEDESDGPRPVKQPAASGESSGKSSAKAPGTAAEGTLLYVSGSMHIESKRDRWPDPDALIAFFRRAAATGMHWSVGPDIGWLQGEPRAGDVVRALEALGVQWDIHAHRHEDRARCAAAIRKMGGHPTAVASGVVLDEVESLRDPVRSGGVVWEAKVLWGSVRNPWHGADSDMPAIGVWRPKSGEEFSVHDPEGDLIEVAGGPVGLPELERLAQEVAGVRDGAPLLSASIMIDPGRLTVGRTQDGIEAVEACAARLSQASHVRWATIDETAEAWVEAGSVPARREVEAGTFQEGPRRRHR